MDKERFSLLLLEPNEIYFEDFSVNLLSGKNDANSSNKPDTRICGRLKMCSKSLVFDPLDFKMPLIKIPYKDCEKIYQRDESFETYQNNVLAIDCNQYTEMLQDNILSPYTFKTEKRTFLFNLHYAKLDTCLPQMCQLHRASSLHAHEQNSMIAAFVYSRHKRTKFDPLWLEDIYEKVIADFSVDDVKPLVLNPGRLLLTTNGIYFQPYNNIQPDPVLKIKLKWIKWVTQRRNLLRHTGLEIQWSADNSTTQTLYVAFHKKVDRDSFHKSVIELDGVVLTRTEPEGMTLKWQNGLISNYDYLLYINSLADRTFKDLTQYPVFPWVVSDYKSSELNLDDPATYRDLTKPIGALNPERLERLLERFNEMGEPKFIYGSHYSAPGLVLFYLVRKYPKLMLCLQNGRFDHPDRMFNRVVDAYNNCLTNMSDFKEVIPEFYDTSQNGDFMINSKKINFGHRHDGTPVNDVELPPWAHNSPQLFVKKLREALESDYVSKNLHHWIDLMFGYKQRGKEAIKSNNLFYYLCYEGSIDLDSIRDLASRHALEVQISEFGQIPKQLFDKPHVAKALINPQSALVRRSCDDDAESSTNNIVPNIKLKDVFQSHKDVISCVFIDNGNVYSTGKDGFLKCFSIMENTQVRSVSINSRPISSCVKLLDSNTLIMGSWDNSILTYNYDYGRVSNVISAHDDAVSCLAYLPELEIIISGSWDCSIKIWKGFGKSSIKYYRMSDSLVSYLSLEEKISCLKAVCPENNGIVNIAVGTFAGDILLWAVEISKISSRASVKELSLKTLERLPNDNITDLAYNASGTKIVACSSLGIFVVVDVSTEMILFKDELGSALTCLDWSRSDETLFLGDNEGCLHMWDMTSGVVILSLKAFNGSMSKIYSSKDDLLAASGFDNTDNCIKVWNIL